MHRICAMILAAIVAVPAVASAADQQVTPGTYRQATKNQFYGRSDGIFYHSTYKTPHLVGNGDGFDPIGPTYWLDLDQYSDGQGAFCEAVFAPGDAGFVIASSANQACDTTCGNAACVTGINTDGAANGATFIACATATSDSCVCQNTGLDLYGVCGANWEAPAIGITRISFGDGGALAHVALLAQDIGADMDADGLDIGGDQTDDDGNELLGGMFGASGRPMMPGIDPAFEFCATVTIEDLDGTDEFWVGWRDTTAPNATFNGYNSYAVIGVDNATGDWHTETEDDGGGTTTTDITLSAWVESTATELCVKVSDAGVATYTVDGASATDAVSYTFDNGEPIIPFIHFLHNATIADEIIVSDWRVVYQ